MMTDQEYQALLTRAEAGDGDAQFALGYHFDVELHDYAAAWKWYQAAAGQKCSAAWNNMAYMLVDGEGRPADPALAGLNFCELQSGDETRTAGIYGKGAAFFCLHYRFDSVVPDSAPAVSGEYGIICRRSDSVPGGRFADSHFGVKCQ